MWMSPAFAAAPTPCDTVAGATTTITCTGDHVTQIDTAGDPTLVTLNPDATVRWGNNDTVISLEGDADLVQKAGSAVYGNATQYAVRLSGDDNSVTLNDGAAIILTNANTFNGNSTAVQSSSLNGNAITLSGGSTIDVYGGSAIKYSGHTITGVSAEGEDFTVTLNSGSSVNVHGTGTAKYSTYIGADLTSFTNDLAGRPSITLNGESSIVVSNSGLNSFATALFGIKADNVGDEKYAPDIVLNGGSTVLLNAYGAANKAIGIYSEGVKTDVTLSGGSAVHVTGYGVGSGGKYTGIYVAEESATSDGVGTVTLNGGSQSSVYLSGAEYARANGITSYGKNGYAANVVLNNSLVKVETVNGDSGTYNGIYVYGAHASVTLNGESNVEVDVEGATYAAGIATYRGNNTVTLNGASEVGVSGDDVGELVGIRMKDGDNTVVMNGSSRLDVYAGSAKDVLGMRLTGDNNAVTLNGSAVVEVDGYAGYAAGILSSGDYAAIAMNGDSRLVVGAGEYVRHAKGIRINGYGSTVTLNDDASIEVTSGYSDNRLGGIVLNNNENMAVTLNDRANVTTSGRGDIAGIYARDVDNSSITLNGQSSVNAGYGIGIQLHESDNNIVTVAAGASVYGGTGIKARGRFNILDIAGTVTGTNTLAIDMRNGNNGTLILNSATINGGIRGGGTGTDHLVLQGAGQFDGTVRDFGDLTVNASGIWNLTNTIAVRNDVNINSGTLAINGTLYADTVYVNSGGTLGGNSNIYADVEVLDGGTMAPGNSPGTTNVVGNVNFASGSIFAVQIEGTAADLLNATGDVIIAPGTIIEPTFGAGADGFVGAIVTAGGVVTGTFTPGSGASVDYSAPGVVKLTAASPSSINGSTGAGSAASFGFLDTVLGQAEKSLSTSQNVWAAVVSTTSDRTANGASRGFSQKGNGGAFGGNLMQTGGFTLGLAGGYTDTSADTTGGGATSEIGGYNAAFYTTYEMGQTFFTAAVTGSYQDMDITRQVFNGVSLVQANGSTNAWLGGAGFGVGHAIPLEGGFTLTPKASLGWQHQTRKGYTETGGGAGAFSVDDVSSDTIRGQVGAELGLKIQDPNAKWSVRPSIRAALAQEWREGDTSATGTFTATGSGFRAMLDTRDQTYLAVGAGVDVTVGGGVTAFASYDGGFGGDAEKSGGIRVGARFAW